MHNLNTDWKRIKVVIFDVDGTLYNQSRMRKKMLFSLLSYYILRPWKFRELKILSDFRKEREKRTGDAGGGLNHAQFEWCATKGNYPLALVHRTVNYWMFTFPNKYLLDCMYPGVDSFFRILKKKGYLIAIYSDYPALAKLDAMNLKADLIVSSTDIEIDRLKPDPKAIFHIAQHFNVTTNECLFIGDRQELDAQCAINAGSPYLMVDKKPIDQFDFYKKLELQLP